MTRPFANLSRAARCRMCLNRICLIVAAVSVIASSTAVAAEYKVKVVAENETAIYEAGSEARFLISVTADDQPVSEGTVSYKVDDYIPDQTNAGLPSGSLVLKGGQAVVKVVSKTSGFVRCHVSFVTPEEKSISAVAGVGFSPLDIAPSLPVPEDFDDFWSRQKALLAKVPMKPELVTVEHDDAALECFDVKVACLGGAPVSGYFAKPKDAEANSLPAVLWVHGAGVRSSLLANAAKGAQAGMLSMDVNAHGIANGKPAAFYKQLSVGKLKNYRHDGRESRETIYFRGMYLRLVRAIDFLTAQPEWNGKVLAVIGHSQGGGQALVAGGIDDRVTLIASGVPAICDHSGRAAGRINGWPKLVPTGDDGKPDPVILEAARYIDAVNFASRCNAEAIMSVGFIDRVCPPSSCYAAYNCLTGDKQVINEPAMGHAAPKHIKDAFFKRIQEHASEK